jgi:hypothetical protein
MKCPISRIPSSLIFFCGKGLQAVPFRQNLLAQRSTPRKTSGDKREVVSTQVFSLPDNALILLVYFPTAALFATRVIEALPLT